MGGIYAEAVDKFSSTGIQISKEGKKYLGSVIGSQEFTCNVVRAKVNAWANEVKKLSNYATCCILSLHTWASGNI